MVPSFMNKPIICNKKKIERLYSNYSGILMTLKKSCWLIFLFINKEENLFLSTREKNSKIKDMGGQ